MKVYRVQNSKGIGPYQGSKNANDWRKKLNKRHWRIRPTPQAEGIYLHEKHFCGFKSLKSLYDWFVGFLGRLEASGFKIICYEINPKNVMMGSQQVVFRKSKRRRIIDWKLIRNLAKEQHERDKM